MPVRVNYRAFARHLSALPLEATCSDLCRSVGQFLDYDPEYGQRLLAGVRELPPETEWLQGLFRVCEVLKADNVRFQPGLFMDWVTEGL